MKFDEKSSLINTAKRCFLVPRPPAVILLGTGNTQVVDQSELNTNWGNRIQNGLAENSLRLGYFDRNKSLNFYESLFPIPTH